MTERQQRRSEKVQWILPRDDQQHLFGSLHRFDSENSLGEHNELSPVGQRYGFVFKEESGKKIDQSSRLGLD